MLLLGVGPGTSAGPGGSGPGWSGDQVSESFPRVDTLLPFTGAAGQVCTGSHVICPDPGLSEPSVLSHLPTLGQGRHLLRWEVGLGRTEATRPAAICMPVATVQLEPPRPSLKAVVGTTLAPRIGHTLALRLLQEARRLC